jgi:hypothetical protein
MSLVKKDLSQKLKQELNLTLETTDLLVDEFDTQDTVVDISEVLNEAQQKIEVEASVEYLPATQDWQSSALKCLLASTLSSAINFPAPHETQDVDAVLVVCFP